MTKRIVAVIALCLVSSSAFASQAKNIVTGGGDGGNILGGTGMYGSFYTNDEYNIFWNPSFINGQKHWAIIENGSTAGTSGGFVTEIGGFNVGAFLNRPTQAGGTLGSAQMLDLVIGGDMGVKWGVGLTRSLSSGAPNYTQVNAGVTVGEFEPFVNYLLKDSNGASSESKFTGMTVGTRYHYEDWTPYVAYQTTKATIAGVAGEAATTWGLGLGREAKLGDVTMNYALSYWRDGGSNPKGSVVPVNMTFSAPAASWLTLRAGFSHNLFNRGAKAAGTATTLGGTIHMGKAGVDMVIGQNQVVVPTDANAFGFAGGLFANVGLTYKW